jgi:hypothetical protein
MKYLMVLLTVLAFGLQSCKKNKDKIKGCTDSTATNYNASAEEDDGTCTYEPQGPKNASFESAYTSSDWNVNNSIFRTNGTGFLPSQGSYYTRMGLAIPVIGTVTNTMFQDQISFNRSHNLTFDYSTSATNFCGSSSATVAILFTSNGTVNLWTKSFDSLTATSQKLNEVIALPSLPNKGKLSVTVSSDHGCNAGTVFYFNLDNLRTN